MARGALLDVDGTLIDANYQHALAWYRAFRAHGITLPVWRIHRHVGMGGDQLVPALVGERLDEEKGGDIPDARDDAYSELIGEVAPLEGARELIDDLREQKLRNAGAMAVFESVEELRKRLDETPLGK